MVKHQAAKPPSPAELGKRNTQDLARVIVTEAGGESKDAQIAVGWRLKNRMTRNNTDNVERVWSPAFQHRKAATATAVHDAAGILNGSVPDPSDGATHFYTPLAMPKEGDRTNIDVGGGLESVPGVTRNGKAVQNYAPAFALSFTPETVDSVPEKTFKFYQQPGGGYVR